MGIGEKAVGIATSVPFIRKAKPKSQWADLPLRNSVNNLKSGTPLTDPLVTHSALSYAVVRYYVRE